MALGIAHPGQPCRRISSPKWQLIHFAAAGVPSKYGRFYRHGSHLLPGQIIRRRHELSSIELDPDMPERRPAERRFLERFRIKADAAAVPPDDLDPICALRTARIKRAAERVLASIAHQRQKAVGSLTKAYRTARQKGLHAGRDHTERTARRIRRSAASSISRLTRMMTPPTKISTIYTDVAGAISWVCFFRKALRQPNSRGGEIPRRWDSAETFTPGCSAAATALSLNSSDHRRRLPTGAPSSRSITPSINCKLPVAGIGVELVVDMEPWLSDHR